MNIPLLPDGRGQPPERVGEKASDGSEDETGDGDRFSEPDDDSDIAEKHLEILKEISSFDSLEGDRFSDFVNRYSNYFVRKDHHRCTLLHTIILAPLWAEEFGSRSMFADWLLESYPTLMLERDGSGETALFKAVSLSRKNYAACFLKAANLGEALRIESFDGRNCFHAAFAAQRRRREEDCVALLLDESILKLDPGALLHTDREGNTPLHLAAAPSSHARLGDVARLIQCCPDAMRIWNKEGESPYKYHYRLRQKYATEAKTESWKAVAEVTELLMLSCMRVFPSADVTGILYGRDPGRQVTFDLRGETKDRISLSYLKNLSGMLSFESTLQSVFLPSIPVEASRSYGSLNEGESRHFETIFEWLRDWGVSRILRVVVDDDHDTPHSDTAIEEALHGFQVEVWDWKRYDICIDVIRNVNASVRVVHLYSTGNLAVLLNWSSPDGLGILSELEEVHVSVRTRLEPNERIGAYVELFLKRLNELRPRLQVNVLGTPKREAIAIEEWTPESSQTDLQWLEVTLRFADMVVDEQRMSRGQDPKGIKVAIIDDGIDAENGRLQIASGMTFSSLGSNIGEFFVGGKGQGNLLATVISSICPTAELYIARVEHYFGAQGHPKVRLYSTIKAIQWALSHGVHIICIGWSLEMTGQPDTIQELREVVRDAEKQGALIFRAKDEVDVNSPGPTPRVFSVRGFRIGTSSTFPHNEHPDLVDFYFPGDKEIADKIHSVMSPNRQLKSPHAMATAVASGVAALILSCAELVRSDLVRELRNPEYMKLALANTCGNDGKTSRFWATLEQGTYSGGATVGRFVRRVCGEVIQKLDETRRR